MKRKTWRKSIAVLLVFAMMMTIMPVAAFAEDGDLEVTNPDSTPTTEQTQDSQDPTQTPEPIIEEEESNPPELTEEAEGQGVPAPQNETGDDETATYTVALAETSVTAIVGETITIPALKVVENEELTATVKEVAVESENDAVVKEDGTLKAAVEGTATVTVTAEITVADATEDTPAVVKEATAKLAVTVEAEKEINKGDADPLKGVNTPDKSRSKSKTATNLDANFQSQVTLSLPSAEEVLSTDILFVLDKSSCNDTVATKAEELMAQLKTAQAETGADINVGIVAFAGTAKAICEFSDIATASEKMAEAAKMKDEEKKALLGDGTNMDAGLELAATMLAADTSVKDNRKYVILVTDGRPRNFNINGIAQTIFDNYVYGDSNTPQIYGGPTSWNLARNNADGSYAVPFGDWDIYLNNVEKWVITDGNQYAVDFYADGKYNSHFWNADEYKQVYPNGKYIDVTDEFGTNHAFCVDRAVYEAYNEYTGLINAGYNCYAILRQNNPLGEAFLNALNKNAGNDGVVDFSSITDEILYVVGVGSYVEDYMGYVEGDYNFDLVNPESMKLMVGEKTYDAVAIEDTENAYGFAPNGNDGYDYVVTYVPGEKKADEHFVWTMHVPVTNFERVSLTYTVQLMNPKTEAGTYGKYDADGSKNEDGLYTNNSATLYPVKTNAEGRVEVAGESEVFQKPTVSYTVAAPTPGPTPGGGDDPFIPQRTDDTPSVTPIPDPVVPQGEPEIIPEEDVPMTDVPGEEVTEVVDTPVPLGEAPATGDSSNAFAFAMVLLAAGLGLVVTRRKFN